MTSSSNQPRSEHWEAVRLSWKSVHIPFGTILIGSLLLASVTSAVSMMWSFGPINPMP
jgi:hypothetical protein